MTRDPSPRPRPVAAALLAALGGCAGDDPPPAAGDPVQAWIVIHVDPLARESEDDGSCTVPGLERCGHPVLSSWSQRNANLRWLAERWLEHGRAADIEAGPEMALSWAEDPEVIAALEAAAEEEGVDPEEVRSIAVAGRETLAGALEAGVFELGVHVHSQLPDAEGTWGSAPKAQNGPQACEGWAGEPLVEGSWSWAERVVDYGINSVGVLAEVLDTDIRTYTGHLPQTMAGKIQAFEDPDGLDPEVTTRFTARYRPVSVGEAYSECLLQSVDHPPFEAWPASPDGALVAGDGPPVVPGDRVAGSMAEHLDAPTDGSAGAAGRRFLQLLLNWRVAALRAASASDSGAEPDAAPPRPWVWTWHAHLFDLNPGQPWARDPAGRDLSTREGSPFRGDTGAIARLLDEFAARPGWAGVASRGAGVVEWRLPGEADLDAAGSRFSYGDGQEPPPEGLDPDRYPYLPLVAEVLDHGHLTCRGWRDGVEVWGIERCPAGWAWASAGPGYRCADRSTPEAVFVLVPEEPACLEVPATALRAAPVDGEPGAMGAPDRCGGDGIVVPLQGLLVEAAAGIGWLGASCPPWNP